jgi:hypothetical protein
MVRDDIIDAPEDKAKKVGFIFNPNITHNEFVLMTMEDKLSWLFHMAQLSFGATLRVPFNTIERD